MITASPTHLNRKLIVGFAGAILLLIILISLREDRGANAQLIRLLSEIRWQGTNSDETFTHWKNSSDNLNQLGADAVPLIIHTLRAQDSKTKKRCLALLNHLPFVRINYITASERAEWLQHSLEPRKRTSQAGVHNLLHLLVQPDVQERDLPDWAANHLAAIGEEAVAPLIEALNSQDLKLCLAAAQTLGRFECSGWTQNHFLIRDYMPGYHAPFQIKPESGERIEQALRSLLLDSDSSVRSAATNALTKFYANNSLKPNN